MPKVPPTGRNSPGLAAILRAPGGPNYRQVDYWTRRGHLCPDRVPSEGERVILSWPLDEQRVAVRMARLVDAGLNLHLAEHIARQSIEPQFNDGAISVELGPGVRVIFEPGVKP